MIRCFFKLVALGIHEGPFQRQFIERLCHVYVALNAQLMPQEVPPIRCSLFGRNENLNCFTNRDPFAFAEKLLGVESVEFRAPAPAATPAAPASEAAS